jgi:hypothetical protein
MVFPTYDLGGFRIHKATFTCVTCNATLSQLATHVTKAVFPATFEKIETVFSVALLRLLLRLSLEQQRFSFGGACRTLNQLNADVQCDLDALTFAMQVCRLGGGGGAVM